MTGEEKAMVLQLRKQGLSISKIANQLNLSSNTVKSFCSRNKENNLCMYCGISIQQPEKVRKKKFCSDKCRMLWWKHIILNLTEKRFILLNAGIAVLNFRRMEITTENTATDDVMQYQDLEVKQMNFHEATAYAGWCTLFSYPELEVFLGTKAFFDISDSLFYKNQLNTRSALN